MTENKLELLCVHAPRKMPELVFLDKKALPAIFICDRCKVSWDEGTPEPEVVIARLR